MSAGAAVRAGVIAALRADAELAAALNGVFEGPGVRASAPFAEVGDTLCAPWGTKDRRGREVRVAVTLRDLAETPARLGELAGAVERVVEAMPPELQGWRVASCAFLRARSAGDGPGRWLGLVEYRMRVLET